MYAIGDSFCEFSKRGRRGLETLLEDYRIEAERDEERVLDTLLARLRACKKAVLPISAEERQLLQYALDVREARLASDEDLPDGVIRNSGVFVCDEHP